MKAKEYAKRYIDAGRTNQALGAVWLDMIKEFETIANVRHASSNEAGVAIMREIEQKWKAFARIIGEINPDGFRDMLKHISPDLAAELERHGW